MQCRNPRYSEGHNIDLRYREHLLPKGHHRTAFWAQQRYSSQRHNPQLLTINNSRLHQQAPSCQSSDEQYTCKIKHPHTHQQNATQATPLHQCFSDNHPQQLPASTQAHRPLNNAFASLCAACYILSSTCAATYDPQTAANAATTSPSSQQSNNITASPGGQYLLNMSKPFNEYEIPTNAPSLGGLQQVQPVKIQLASGLRIWLVEDHEVPLVRGTLLMPGGMYAAPTEKLGIASLSGSVQRLSGSKQHPGDSFDSELDNMAAKLGLSVGELATQASFSCSSTDVEPVLKLLTEIVSSPNIQQDKVDLVKSQLLNAVSHRNDNTTRVAVRYLGQQLYGADSVYARDAQSSTIKSITVADVEKHLAKWQRADTALLGLVGDFDASKIQPILEQSIGKWKVAPNQPDTPPPLPLDPIPPQPPASITYIHSPGSGTTTVALGEQGALVSDPDFYPLEVLSRMLNDYGGTLFDKVRSQDGLAYSVAGGWTFNPLFQGLFAVVGDTDRPVEFIKDVQGVMRGVYVGEGIGNIQDAKDSTQNSFVFNYSSLAAQLSRLMVYDFVGLDQSFFDQYVEKVEGVSLTDITEAAGRKLHVDNQVIVVCGDEEGLLESLQSMGDVKQIEVSQLST